MKPVVRYQYGNPFKIRFREHVCTNCGFILGKKEKSKIVNSKSKEAKFYDFTLGEISIKGDCKFVHKVFYCNKCGQETEFITQISYEDYQKWVKNAYRKLSSHFDSCLVEKLWTDNENNIMNNEPIIENFQGFKFRVTINNMKHDLPFVIASQSNHWERPVQLTKNKKYTKILKHLIKVSKRISNDEKNINSFKF